MLGAGDRQGADDVVDGSSVRGVLGNQRADEFARIGAELHAPDTSDVAIMAARPKLVKWRNVERPRSRTKTALAWCRSLR